MNIFRRIVKDDMHGVHYAVSVFIATSLLYVLVMELGDGNPIWAVSSMIATSDPQLTQAKKTFAGRILNTLIGCVVGLAVVAVGRSALEMPIALALTVLITSYLVRIPTMWRQAPITAAIVIAGSLHHHTEIAALEAGLQRVGEVLLGCVVGIVVAWTLSKVWPLPHSTADATGAQGSPR